MYIHLLYTYEVYQTETTWLTINNIIVGTITPKLWIRTYMPQYSVMYSIFKPVEHKFSYLRTVKLIAIMKSSTSN